MNSNSSPSNLKQTHQYINQLDLGYVINAMCAPHYPLPCWTQEDAKHCCQLYKNFLFLQKKYLSTPLVPTREIDEFWHNHILYTRNYLQDCLQIFGHYLHHEPAAPDDAPEKLLDGFTKTKELYLAEFGQSLVVMNR